MTTYWSERQQASVQALRHPDAVHALLSRRVRGCHNAEVTSETRKPRMTSAQRYWASMAAIVVATILVAGLLGGTVSLLTGAREGRSSMWGGMVVALVMLAGWTLGTRVRDRKKLDLPLWRRLTEEQAATLKQYHQWSRTGRIDRDDDSPKGVSSEPSGRDRSSRTGGGASSTSPSRMPSPRGTMSKRDRARAADDRDARAARRTERTARQRAAAHLFATP